MNRAVSGAVRPPLARRSPVIRTVHGDSVTDEFAWLEDTAAPETVAFLEAQNAYTAAATGRQAPLVEAILGEIASRAQAADLSAPVRKGSWWYYERTIAGRQYPVHGRVAARAAGSPPSFAADGSAPDGEQILLDENEAAAGETHFALGAFEVSPDGARLAYSADLTGNERFTLRVVDLTGSAPPPGRRESDEAALDEISGAHYGVAWSPDASALYYVTADESWRPCRVWRHVVGSYSSSDTLVFEEKDERFAVRVALARSGRLVFVSCASRETSEVWLIDAAHAGSAPRVVAPRRQGVVYSVDHQAAAGSDGRLLILHNAGSVNFELATASLTAPDAWAPLVPHRADTRMLGVYAFETFIALSFRRDGLTGLRILPSGGENAAGGPAVRDHELGFAEPLYAVRPGDNPDFQARHFRFTYESYATPPSVYDYNAVGGKLTLVKRRAVRALPGGPPFDPADYEQHRAWATASDGTAVPISIVCGRGTPRDGSAAFLLLGYGGYEISIDPAFSATLPSLFDRGCGFAVAHVRGGGELGRDWHEAGRLGNKPNSFTDFVACARHLAATGWTRPDRLIARGVSAGGLLVGAAVNLAPEAFGGVIAQVPFVDVLTTMLDPARPLTVAEWEEWGDPLHDPDAYRLLKSYSPYENVRDVRYPPVFALAALQDARVPVSEAAKWIARLQAVARGGPFLLKTAMGAGHGGPSGRYDLWHAEAEILAWAITTARPDAATGD